MLGHYLIFAYHLIGFRPFTVILLNMCLARLAYLLLAYQGLALIKRQRHLSDDWLSGAKSIANALTIAVFAIVGFVSIQPLSQREYTPSEWLSHTNTPTGQYIKPRLISEHTKTLAPNDIVKFDSDRHTITYVNAKDNYQSMTYAPRVVHYHKTAQANSPRIKLHYQTISFAYATNELQYAMLLSSPNSEVSASHTIQSLTAVDVYLSPADYAKQVLSNNNQTN